MFKKLLAKNKSFIKFGEKMIEERDLKPGTKIVYKRQIEKIKSMKIFNKFKNIDSGNVLKFNKILKASNYKQTYINNLNRLISSIINEAIVKGYLTKNPYQYTKLKKNKTNSKRHIEKEMLQKIENNKFSKNYIQYAADLFIFCSHTGISYADLFKLKSSQIIKDDNKFWLIGDRIKTGENFTSIIDNKAIEIIKKYKVDQDFIFNKKISIATYNRNLKEVSKEANLNIQLSSHMAKHRIYSFPLRASRL